MTDENLSGVVIDAEDNSNPTDVVVETEKTEDAPAEVAAETPTENKDSGEAVKKPKLTGWQRKIQKLERELEAERLKNVAPSTPAAAPQVNSDQKPILDNYQTYDDYIEALTEFKATQVAEKKLAERENKVKTEQVNQSWNTKVAEAVKEMPDYHEVVSEYADVPVRQEILDAMRESDIGPKMAYHLAKNPDLLDELNGQSVSAYTIHKELSRLESELTGNKEQNRPAVKISKAPPPITPVKKTASGSVDLNNMDTDSYINLRMNRPKK